MSGARRELRPLSEELVPAASLSISSRSAPADRLKSQSMIVDI